MAFQAKRLRVALPCEEQTLIEPGVPFAADEKIVKPFCIDWGSQHRGSCADDFTWYLLINPAPIALDVEHLPIVRKQLEAKLEEVRRAEQALEDRGSDK
jgi:hypothetical protein